MSGGIDKIPKQANVAIKLRTRKYISERSETKSNKASVSNPIKTGYSKRTKENSANKYVENRQGYAKRAEQFESRIWEWKT